MLEGQSNDQGKVDLTTEQNETLKTRYDQTPNQLWLVYADQAREVAYPRQGDRQQTIQEFVHTLTAQSNLNADRMRAERETIATQRTAVGKREAAQIRSAAERDARSEKEV